MESIDIVLFHSVNSKTATNLFIKEPSMVIIVGAYRSIPI